MRIRKVGEALRRSDVAAGEDARIRGLQTVVDLDAARREGDRGVLEAEPLDVRRPPGGDENLVHRQLVQIPFELEVHHLAALRTLDALQAAARDDAHAVGFESPLNGGGALLLFARQKMIAAHQQGDLAAETREGLCQLAAGQVPELGETRQVGDRRAAAGGDQRSPEAQRGAGDRERIGGDEPAFAEEQIDPEVAQAPG